MIQHYNKQSIHIDKLLNGCKNVLFYCMYSMQYAGKYTILRHISTIFYACTVVNIKYGFVIIF